VYNEGGLLNFQLEITPPPTVNFWFSPGDPSAFDTIEFYDSSYDPANIGVASCTWDFGDGSTAEGCYATHRFAADGDYTVTHAAITSDGRTSSVSQIVSVRTHDVGITKFIVSQSARTPQTRLIIVGIKNTRYPENVRIELYKSTPSGNILVGTAEIEVPVRVGNRTTDFIFIYTFTAEDVLMGKVTFKAVATLINARDAFYADNEAISLPVRVRR
jgi:PKD repeat protein